MMHAVIKDGKILLYDSYIFKESIKEIPGRQWHPEEKAWSVPISQQSIETLDLLGCELSDKLTDIRQGFASENTADETTLLPAPLKVSPYEHQLSLMHTPYYQSKYQAVLPSVPAATNIFRFHP